MLKNVAIYARFSTDRQAAEQQIQELREIARRSNWNIVAEFVDQNSPGAMGGNTRPQFHALLKAAKNGEFEMVLSWSVDQLGQSFEQLGKFLVNLHTMNCDLYLYKQRLNTLTPEGRAMFQMCGILAEFNSPTPREVASPALKPVISKLNNPVVAKKGNQVVTENYNHGAPNSLKRQVHDLRETGLRRAKIAEKLGVSDHVVDMVIGS